MFLYQANKKILIKSNCPSLILHMGKHKEAVIFVSPLG